MYIRFVCNRPHPEVAAEAGIFHAYWTLLESIEDEPIRHVSRRGRRCRVDRVRRRRVGQLREAVRFLRDLNKPYLHGKDRIRGSREALFWFRAEAALEGRGPGTMIFAVQDLARHLAAWGFEIRTIRARMPGTILWQDAHQILARPVGHVPRAFA